jgi:uncharacterized membrane protein YdjX (TVP38/TMEM64 family)
MSRIKSEYIIVLLLFIIILITLLYPNPLLALIKLNLRGLQFSLQSSPYSTIVSIIVLLILQSIIIVIPFTPIVIVSGWIFGGAGGFVISWTGLFIGQYICYYLSKKYGNRYLAKIASNRRINYVRRLSGDNMSKWCMLLLYLSSVISFDILSIILGLLNYSTKVAVIIIMIGIIPKLILLSVLGDYSSVMGYNSIIMVILTIIIFVIIFSYIFLKKKKNN